MKTNSDTAIAVIALAATKMSSIVGQEAVADFVESAMSNASLQYYLFKRDPVDSVLETLSEFTVS